MSRRVYCNGNIYTMCNGEKADYVIVKDGIIEKVGFDPYDGDDAEVFDLNGLTMFPGFIDSHNHMLTAGLAGFQFDLTNKEYGSIEELMNIIRDYADNDFHGEWIRCVGFNETKLAEGRMLDRFDLDMYIDHRPIIMTRVCSHVSVFNSKGLMKLELGDAFNGVVKDEVQTMVLKKLPGYSEDEIIEAIDTSQKELFKMGICCVHEPGTDQVGTMKYLEAYKKAEDSGILKMRTYLMGRKEENGFSEVLDKVSCLMNTYSIEKTRLFFGAMKFFADGSIGGRTAALKDGYDGKLSDELLLTEDLDRYSQECVDRGFQISIHAIGDMAIEYVIDSIESFENKSYKTHRIEHCELCNEKIIGGIKKNNIMVSFQPAFIHEFGDKYIKNLGIDRIRRIKPIKSFIDEKLVFSFSADYPFADGDPLQGVKHAVERKTRKGNAVNEKERISVYEALKAYTVNGSKLSCTEKYHGTLSEGKFADFTIVDKDILNDGIEGVRVVYTIIDDEVVYSSIKTP